MFGKQLFFILSGLLSAFLSNPEAYHSTPSPQNHTAWTVAWSHNDRYLAVGNDNGELSIYETGSWKEIKSWRYDSTTISRVEWNPSLPLLAVASTSFGTAKNVVQLYDAAADKVIAARADTLQGRALSWSPSGDALAFVGARGRIHIYAKDGKQLKSLSFTHPRSLFEIDWHPQKDILLAVEEDIYQIDVKNDQVKATFNSGAVNKGILCCKWHPSGRFFVTGDYGHEGEGGEPSYLKFWSEDGALLRRIERSKAEYRNISWSNDGAYLAAAGDGLLLFDAQGNFLRNTKFSTGNIWGVHWNSKGNQIAISDGSGVVRVTDRAGKILRTLK